MDTTLIWKFRTNGVIVSSPVISGDRVIFGSFDNHLYCLNSLTGEKNWWFETGAEIGWCAPLVVGNRVFFGGWNHKVYCLDITTGQELWEYKTDGGIETGPTLMGGDIVVGADDGHVYQFSQSSGLIYGYPVSDSVISTAAAAPIHVDGVSFNGLFVGLNNGTVMCFKASPLLEVVWEAKIEHGLLNVSSPAVMRKDGYAQYVYIGGRQSVYCLDAQTGKTVWQTNIGGEYWVMSSPTIFQGKIYIGSEDNRLYCLDAFDGSKQWEFPTNGQVVSSPAVTGGYVYVGCSDGNVYCLNAQTGEEVWVYHTGDQVLCSPAVVYNCVYVGSDDGYFYCLKAAEDDIGSWPMFKNNPERTSEGTQYWASAYKDLFSRPTDLELFRKYRDKVLSKTADGQFYTKLLYENSEVALQVLLSNPELMAEARNLIDKNRDSIYKILNRKKVLFTNLKEIFSFMDKFSEKSPESLKTLARTVKESILEKHEQGKNLLGFLSAPQKMDDKEKSRIHIAHKKKK
jgi:outer membrane protein assembly factor BamB